MRDETNKKQIKWIQELKYLKIYPNCNLTSWPASFMDVSKRQQTSESQKGSLLLTLLAVSRVLAFLYRFSKSQFPQSNATKATWHAYSELCYSRKTLNLENYIFYVGSKQCLLLTLGVDIICLPGLGLSA